MREDAILAAYESAQERMNLSFDEFQQRTENWIACPVHINGKLVGAVLMDGPVIHACINPEGFGRWLTKRVLKDTLCRILREHGHAVTHVQDGNAEGEYFVRRLGFRKEGDKWVLRQQ